MRDPDVRRAIDRIRSRGYLTLDADGTPIEYVDEEPDEISFGPYADGHHEAFRRERNDGSWWPVNPNAVVHQPLPANEPITLEAPMPTPYMSASELEAARLNVLSALGQIAKASAVSRRFPAQPPVTSILKFERRFARGTNAPVYTYVALRATADSWHLTDTNNPAVLTWEQLQEKIGNNKAWLMTGEKEIPVAEVPDIDKEADPAKWFEMAFPQPGKEITNGEDKKSE